MRILLFSLATFFAAANLFAQTHLAKVNEHDPSLPEWARMMYADDPDVNAVSDAYTMFYATHPFEKTIHTQYFMLWMNSTRGKIGTDGHIVSETAQQRAQHTQAILDARSGERGGGWTFCGPDVHHASDGSLTEISEQANTYCHDRALDAPNLLYCGTECGGVYKTIDAGAHWSFVTKSYLIGAVSAVRIRPDNSDIVIISAENDLWRTNDGGLTWNVIGDATFQGLDISAWEIAYDPSDNNIVLAATNLGMFRSTDGGDNWTVVLPENCETIAYKPDDPSTVYTIEFEPTLNYSRFYKSTDHGVTWTMFNNGWYAPPVGEDGLYEITGGRIAVSAADPNRIYGLLVGYQQAGASITTNGWIGVWRSDDAGATWTFPHDSIGTPYTPTHPNLMNFQGDDGTYSQIHYNTTMVASQLDADKVLIGGLNLWKSNDGCATYQGVGGYIGGLNYLHVDMQELRIYQTGPSTEEVWLSSDGGIQHSGDFFGSFQARDRGIEAGNLWGYDQGWNDDIRVGGRYHNGNMGFYEAYPQNEYLALGGGEAATGYVSYGDERKTFFSDIDGKVLPTSLDQQPQNFSMDLDPNESYYNCNSSRILFDNGYYDVAWSGKDNVLMKSVNGGSNFTQFHAFGTTLTNHVLWIDQPFSHPEVLYVQQNIGNTSRLWRTTNSGSTWTQMSLPSTSRNLYFTAGADANELWVAYTDRPNGQKVYHTTDGSTWQNITTSALDGAHITAIAHQLGTDGGVYIGVRPGSVYYRDNTMSDWENWSTDLPVSADPLRIVPFYKGGKVRFAAWNLAVWERDFHSASDVIANFSSASNTFYCPGDTVHFIDHSVCTANATYQWSFPGETLTTSSEKFPDVVYTSPGIYDVTLTVTDNGQTSTITKPAYIGSVPATAIPLMEGFESGMFASDWKSAHSNGGNSSWGITANAGGSGLSTHSMWFDNYDIDVAGKRDEEWTGKSDFSGATNSYVKFDVAYARYGGQYSDTLAVLVSTDCGDTWSTLYIKGGDELSTSPQNTDFFTPVATQWRTDSVFLGAFDGLPEVVVAFQNRGHWGNNIYVDNINITAVQIVGVHEQEPSISLSVFPNPASDVLNIVYGGQRSGPMDLRVINAMGELVMRDAIEAGSEQRSNSISVEGLDAGIYTIMLGPRIVRFEVLPR